MVDLTGKRVLITGATSGIGAGAAEVMAKLGATIGVLSKDEKEVRHAAERLARFGVKAHGVTADVKDQAQMRAAVERFVQEAGGIDVCVANAGINGVRATIERVEEHEYDEVMDINLKGTYITCRLCAPHLKATKGNLVIVSSVNGNFLFNDPGAAIYSASKAAQVALGKAWALELAQHGVRVNMVCPGSIDTNIERSVKDKDREDAAPRVEYPDGEIPLTRGKPGTAEQVGKLIAFLASDAADHISGTTVVIDGAQSILE